MTLLPLPSQTLAWLKHAADAGQRDAQALLHLIARADKRDQDVAEFVDSYSKTIAALCRRLEALERGAGLRHPVEDAEATESDSVADDAQRITDTATQIRREAVELATTSALDHAGLIAFALGRKPWATWLRKGGCLESAHCELSDLMLAVLARWGHSTPPAPAAPVDDSPVANALTVAEAALADVAEGAAGGNSDVDECLHWTETRCTEALAAIRPVMRKHGIRTSEWPPAVPAPAAPDPVEPESEVCETCDGEGTIDERLGGISTSNPAATCPDCDGVGEPRRLHRQQPAAPTPPPTALVEVVGNELPLLPDGRVDEACTRALIHKVAAWLDTQGDHGSANRLRSHVNR